MTQVPILKGVYADQNARMRVSLPVNLEPVIVESGLSDGQLISAPGITQVGPGPGADRGGIDWKGVCYRVMGTKLVSVVGVAITVLGDVGPGGTAAFDYSFDRLAINSGDRLYYWDGAALTQVTDPDLGLVRDVQWIDGYFMTTDGEFLVVTELNDPYSVDPLKYGSSEVDPDEVMGLEKVRGQVYALNRNTIENFVNQGGTGFPFARNSGGMIPKGCVGPRAHTPFLESFAFVGSGREEALSVYIAGPGQAAPLGDPEIDAYLAALTPDEQRAIECESRIEEGEQRLYVRLPDKTLVYYHQSSKTNQGAVWSILASGTLGDQAYVGHGITLSQGKWYVGSPTGQVGYLDQSVETQFGAIAGQRFDTVYLYNDARGLIIKMVELIGLPGQAPFGDAATIFLSFTRDGRSWGQERAISMGKFGQRRKRLQWRPMMRFERYVGMRFRVADTSLTSVMRLEIEAEGLSA